VCLLIADVVVDHDGGEGDAAKAGQGVLVIAGRDSAPLFEPVEPALDRVAVKVLQESKAGGRPPTEPLALRRPI